jgi:hypothetical protein
VAERDRRFPAEMTNENRISLIAGETMMDYGRTGSGWCGWMGRVLFAGTLVAGMGRSANAQQFMKPTAEELAMKELPGYPGVAAVALFREQITKDDLHVVQHYDRIKVLTEEGKSYANIELRYVSTSGNNIFESTGDDKTLGEIAARTIHADGTVIPFTAKPYRKTMEKGGGVKYQALVFTLPDVEIGSILEYRYNTRINDNTYESPTWFIQGDLYLKSAHYMWLPTTRQLVDQKERSINTITWFPILPDGAKIERKETPSGGPNGSTQHSYELNVKDVPPQPREEFMPPIASYSYRVYFNFSASRTYAEYWKEEGKDWSKRRDSFTNPNGDLSKATAVLLAGAATPDEKLRRIYAAVMKLENTNFTRAREQREDKAAGAGKTNNASDVLKHERGSATQLTELFVGMARAAGLKAYLMLVPDRSLEVFTEGWLSFEQFDATIAIVNVDGKELMFDPGSRYCQYGHLAWQHTAVRGLRQVEGGGTEFAQTLGTPYIDNKVTRIANLEMDEQGVVTGKVDLTFTGEPALEWRQRALSGDEESLRTSLRTSLEAMVPKSLEVKVAELHGVDEYEKPFSVTYEVKGSLGNTTGKRLVLPVNLFEAGTAASFPHEKRELAVYFHYAAMHQDALRIKFPKAFELEAVPAAGKFSLPGRETYGMIVESTPTSFTTRRTFLIGELLVNPKDYGELRKFYTQLESKDKENVVLKMAAKPVATGM